MQILHYPTYSWQKSPPDYKLMKNLTWRSQEKSASCVLNVLFNFSSVHVIQHKLVGKIFWDFFICMG